MNDDRHCIYRCIEDRLAMQGRADLMNLTLMYGETYVQQTQALQSGTMRWGITARRWICTALKLNRNTGGVSQGTSRFVTCMGIRSTNLNWQALLITCS